MPTINLIDDEIAALTAAIRRTIEDDRYPHAPRLDPLHAALGKFEAASRAKPRCRRPRPCRPRTGALGECLETSLAQIGGLLLREMRTIALVR